ncbi:MAG: RNA methyltransferase [Alphaproteobacteria bacterium]|nr:RNA methyltransferase [Alphaproteobacteria bacterium]
MTPPVSPSSGFAPEHVTSVSNDTVKRLRSLDRKKAREETGLFLAEGARLIEEGLRHGWRPAVALAGLPALERPRTADLLERLRKAGARTLTASEKVMSAVSRKDNPQTVIAAFHQRLSTLTDLPTEGARRWLALFEVRDPGNLGTILRTGDAAGVDAVVLIGDTCDPFSMEAVRASMGSVFAMPLARADAQEFLRWKAATGAQLTAASMRGRQRHDQVRYQEKSIVVLGNEQSGLPPSFESECDVLVRIPMAGAADSLNLASAAGVMIYEVWRSTGYEGAAS